MREGYYGRSFAAHSDDHKGASASSYNKEKKQKYPRCMDAKAEGIGSENSRTPESGENTFRKRTHCREEGVYIPIRHIVEGEGKPR